MPTEVPLTLREVQYKLETDQHVLIHLCEKGVIIPDLQETEGRGKSRKFSKRNLFEFAVALALRKYQIPISIVAACIRLLRSFERSTLKLIKPQEFRLSETPGLNLYLFDGRYLVFEVSEKKLLLGFNITKVLKIPETQIKIDKLHELPKRFESFLKLNISEIANSVS